MSERQFEVRFYPAERRPSGGIQVKYSLRNPPPKTIVAASSTSDLVAKIDALGAAQPEPVKASVDALDNKRKMRGYDAAVRDVYYNLNRAPAGDPATATSA
jgi:hypothetical protein